MKFKKRLFSDKPLEGEKDDLDKILSQNNSVKIQGK